MRIALLAAAVALGFAAAASASSPPGFAGCSAYAKPHPALVTRPATIVAACGDGNFYFTNLRWTSWGATSVATGVAHQNDCTPSCAAGRFHAYPARVTLSVPKTCGGRTELTRLAWRFTSAKPHDVPRTGSESFRCA